jgi:hypothetical protein
MSQLCFKTFPEGNLIHFVYFLAVLFGFKALRGVNMNAADHKLRKLCSWLTPLSNAVSLYICNVFLNQDGAWLEVK